jgi:chitinase
LSFLHFQAHYPSSHILYAFADLRPDSGEVVLSDAWADKDIHYPGDSWNDVGNNLYGNFKAIYKLKQQNRHLKVLLSIGGWTYSPKFHPIVVNPALRANFVRSAVRLLEDYGLDGLDVDYEYPSNEHQARGYVDLLRELRAGLDHHAQMKGIYHRFLLTVRHSTLLTPPSFKSEMLPFARSLLLADPTTIKSYTYVKWTSTSIFGI